MRCLDCDNPLLEGANFCEKCGSPVENGIDFESGEQELDLPEDDELTLVETSDGEVTIIKQEEYPIENENNGSKVSKFFKGVGLGGFVVGWGFLGLAFYVLWFIYVALAGLSMVFGAIKLFQGGSIFWGLIVLLLGTPLAVGLAGYFFVFLLIFSIIALLVWGVISMLGIETSFSDVYSWLWFGAISLAMIWMAFAGISSFIESIKRKKVGDFFLENWFYIAIFLFLFWLFFLR